MSITVEGLRAAYVRDVPILNGIDVEVRNGEIVTIIGPNGSGKSTLLRALMGHIPYVEGTLLVDDDSIVGASSHRRINEHALAYVPQLDNVFAPLTIEENLELGGQALSRAQRQQRVQEMYDWYPKLGDRRRRRADTLSGGERQTLALARALVPSPTHLLLDEPSAGLSPRLLSEMFEAIERISTEFGVSVLLVEQNAAQALSISDRGYVLVMGEVALTDTADGILDNADVNRLYLGG